MKKIITIILCLSTITAFSGCGKKEDAQKDMPDNEVISQETEKAQTDNNSVIGTWIVEKNEVYDGPMKEIVEQTMSTMYYPGTECVFKEDGVYEVKNNSMVMKYEVLSDTQMQWENISTGQKDINDYELNGDELILYVHYTGGYSHLGHAGATYFKRK